MPFPDPSLAGWSGPQTAPAYPAIDTDSWYSYTPPATIDQAQAERDHQAQQLGLPVGLNEADYMAAFQQLMASPEWAALQQSRQEEIAAQSAATWEQYQQSKDDRFKKFQIAAALGLGGAGLVAALGPGVTAAGGAAGGGSAATAGLSEIGLPAGVGYLPGGTGVTGAGASGVTAAFGGAGMAALPTAIATPAAISGLTGVPNAADPAGGVLDSSGSAIPGAGGVGGATNALGTAGASGIPDWVSNYLLPGINAGLGVYGANQASDAMSESADRAIAEGARQYDTTRTDLMPWMDAGRAALGRINDPNGYTSSPDYNFIRGEGTRDIQNTFAAQGMGQSGNALRALTEFNSGLAATDYGNWYNRQASQAGLGQTATSQLGAFGANRAANAGNAFMQQGNARASGVLGATNAVQNGLYDAYDNYLYRRRRVGG